MAALLLFVILNMFYTTTGKSIPAGFDFVTHGFGKSYYGCFRNLNFADSVALCATIGGQILKIRGEDERTFLESVDKAVWLDVANLTHWRDGSEMTYHRFRSHAYLLNGDCVYMDLRTRGTNWWVIHECSADMYVLCEINHNTPAPPIPTQAYVSLSDLIARHENASTFQNSVNLRFDNLERRLEQMSRGVFTRLDAIEGNRDGNSNNTGIGQAMTELQSKQNSMSESLAEIKRMMAILYNALHSNAN